MTQTGTSRIRSRIAAARCAGRSSGWGSRPIRTPESRRPTRTIPTPRQRSRPLIGTQIMLGMKPAGTGKWAGQVYNAEDGKTYSGNLTFTGGNSLQFAGLRARRSGLQGTNLDEGELIALNSVRSPQSIQIDAPEGGHRHARSSKSESSQHHRGCAARAASRQHRRPRSPQRRRRKRPRSSRR